MKDKLPLISIIVPVYNAAAYLDQCVESLINQTYSNIEIILVDDGSTDESGRLCDKYALDNKNISVVHKINGGLAQARNTGMTVANGEYVMFVDSDDWVDACICEVLINALYEYNAEMAMCAYVREYPGKALSKIICNENALFCGSDIQRKLCGPISSELRNPENMDCFNPMWGKLYPIRLLENKNVTDNSVIGPSEDLLFNLEVFSSVDNMVYINQPLYHYRKSVGSSITATYKHDIDKKMNTLYDRMADAIEKSQSNKMCFAALNNRIAVNVLGIGLNCVSGNAGFVEKYRRVKLAMCNGRRKEALKHLSLKEMPFHWKLFYFCAKHELVLLLCTMLISINMLRGKI